MVGMVYGGWDLPANLLDGRHRSDMDIFLLGTPVSKGGSGIVDGNPAITKFLGKADFCGPGAYIDEASKASEVNCELVEFSSVARTISYC